MVDIPRQKTSSSSDLEESLKNDEYLLGFKSQYKTELYKEEETEGKENMNNKDPKELNMKQSSDSTSVSFSQDYNSLSEINLKRRSDLSKDDTLSLFNNGQILDLNERRRKMSSPLCDYFGGFDKYLSRTLRTTIDLRKSPNFVKKAEFFSGENSINNLNNIEEQKQMNNLLDKNQNKNIHSNKEINTQNNISKKLKFNNIINNNQFINNKNINNYNNNYINNNLYFLNNNYPQNQIFNINYINFSNFPNNTNNIMNKRKMSYNNEADFIGNYFNNILNQKNITNQNDPNFIHLSNQANLNSMLFSYNELQDNYKNQGINNNKNNIKKNSGNIKSLRKPLDKRKGDWYCPKCNNLNFAFRVICNRCQLQKPKNLDGKNE